MFWLTCICVRRIVHAPKSPHHKVLPSDFLFFVPFFEIITVDFSVLKTGQFGAVLGWGTERMVTSAMADQKCAKLTTDTDVVNYAQLDN
ncbi:hypothetical protein AVEN_181326-1 [Araneus ventricosus]|uniref:Uncharacterized protein n=1 Tax=Araneus ventricosus TaxID=182803 RepID=A0A4Y1ZRX3_ARAVE|nr:hypothetical protein AVEN_181326-1 [Araneus ventricosus]